MNKKLLHDIILAFAVIIISLCLIFILSRGGKEGEYIEITISGEDYGSYPLGSDRTVDVDGKLTVVIEGGKAHIENSLCPQKECEKCGEISHPGEMLVCLPQGIIVRVCGNGENDFNI